MILYSLPTSPYSAAVRIGIAAKELALTIAEPPGGLKSEEYRALSWTGTVPCLVLDDGTPLPESQVILAYLDRRFAERPLAPATLEGRARVALLVRLALDGVLDPIVGLFHDLSVGAPNAAETALERLSAGLGKLAPFVSEDGYAAGPAFSMADCFLGVGMAGIGMVSGMLGPGGAGLLTPKLTAYAGRVLAHPAVAKVLAEMQAAMPAQGPG